VIPAIGQQAVKSGQYSCLSLVGKVKLQQMEIRHFYIVYVEIE
jgi:hypothetical protein